ncbi:MAG TPA: M55 family metallopeptidase [Vicinamibacterales bacterium]|nr:M55 family metallopeptidase [Vicinamibacterales bacterium]
MKRIGLVLFCACALAAAAPAAAQRAPKIFVSVDMEGIWGVVHGEQVNAGSPEFANARRWMAEDVNAVVAGLFEAGAGEIVVNDSHGGMRNIVADAINPKVSLVSGSPKPLGMMQGIDGTYDAVVFVGYHARAGSAPAILDHTISSATIRGIRVNGQELPELGLNAALAGYFDVPVILLTGDTETCGQARAVLGGGLVTAAVKEAIGRTAARMYPAEAARARLKEAGREAIGGRATAKPFRIEGPYTFEVEFHSSLHAELPSALPGVTRTAPRSVSFGAADYLQGFRLLRAIISLASAG